MLVTGLPAAGVRSVAAGGEHAAALAMDGTVWTWGSNNAGALGNNAGETAVNTAANFRANPVRVRGGQTNVLHFSLSSAGDRIDPADRMSPAARFFMWFGIAHGILLILLIVLFILDNRRVIDIKAPGLMRTFFDKIPVRRAPVRARAAAGSASARRRTRIPAAARRPAGRTDPFKRTETAKRPEPVRRSEPVKRYEPAKRPEPPKRTESVKRPEPPKRTEPVKRNEPPKRNEPGNRKK